MTIEQRLDYLTGVVFQLQRNITPLVDNIDSNTAEIKTITPYTDTKTAYIDDTEVIFTNVPAGAWYVSFSKDVEASRVTKDGSVLTVEFEPLEEVTEVTITVQ